MGRSSARDKGRTQKPVVKWMLTGLIQDVDDLKSDSLITEDRVWGLLSCKDGKACDIGSLFVASKLN